MCFYNYHSPVLNYILEMAKEIVMVPKEKYLRLINIDTEDNTSNKGTNPNCALKTSSETRIENNDINREEEKPSVEMMSGGGNIKINEVKTRRKKSKFIMAPNYMLPVIKEKRKQKYSGKVKSTWLKL